MIGKYLVDGNRVYRIRDVLPHDCVDVAKYHVKNGKLRYQGDVVIPLDYRDVLIETEDEAIKRCR